MKKGIFEFIKCFCLIIFSNKTGKEWGIDFPAPSLHMCSESIEMTYNIKIGQHHDAAPSLNYTVISIDSPHLRKDGSNYLKFLLN